MDTIFPKGGLAVSDYIIVGIDVHKGSLVVKWSVDKGEPTQCSYENTPEGRRALERRLAALSEKEGAAQVVCAYEASYQGNGLCRDLEGAGFVCRVLAPTKIAKPAASRKKKTDARDAIDLLEVLKGHLLAGNRLPAIWVSHEQTLQDRELVRGRQDVSDKLGRLRTQVASLLARWGVRAPREAGGAWTKRWRQWAEGLAKEVLGHGPAEWLLSLLRQVASYVGLAPSSHDSGESERKGHITHQGSKRVRKALCQAVWAALRTSMLVKRAFARLIGGKPKRSKIAVVALMRQLAIKLWHAGLRAQRAAPRP